MPNQRTSNPQPCEKTALKYILDSLNQRERGLIPVNEPTDETQTEVVIETKSPTASNKAQPMKPIPQGKKYFRIGEAADLIGVEPHVLRYWESEFKEIRPMKSKSGHRVYSRKDITIFQYARQLLYIEKFSVKGAKKRIRNRKNAPIKLNSVETAKTPTIEEKTELKKLLSEIKELISIAKESPGY